MENYPETWGGSPTPLGISKTERGLNFALFSKNAHSVTLCLFRQGIDKPFSEIHLDHKKNKFGHIWHIEVAENGEEWEYGYRIDGPHHPAMGLIYNKKNMLIDPYAKELNTHHDWEGKRQGKAPNLLLGRAFDKRSFDWDDVRPPEIAIDKMVIYEMHVRAFTQHPSSNVKQPGTYAGLIEKIPYLKSLGVTSVELLPVFEFDECENQLKDPETQKLLCNFWGYSTVNFFAPMTRYATSSDPGQVSKEFKEMVKAFHAHGIEVILDVVYNHTSEGEKTNEKTICFRGIDNATYYLLDNSGHYKNYSGCGNTLNCNHEVVIDLIIDSLRHWVLEYHIDGFRFDLASILTRGENGAPLSLPPCVQAIAQDPVLADVKLIAEAWDAGGLYQVGTFPSFGRWMEWNGKYRDHVRSFIKGTDGKAGDFSKAVTGSQDLYGHGRKPYHSVNFIIAHDGFSLHDLVSYQDKHNKNNGEKNLDGTNDNESWNCGVEGKTDDPKIIALRERQMRNLITALFVSIGTPMIYMGDEYAHTRFGNNNAYCQDSELNWFLWDELEKKKEFFRFYHLMIEMRRNEPLLNRTDFLRDEDIVWHGIEPGKPNWEFATRFVAYVIKDAVNFHDLYIAFNANFKEAHLHLPLPGHYKKWYRIVDTSLASPNDFIENPQSLEALPRNYILPPYSALVAKAF
jgi:isoamylase